MSSTRIEDLHADTQELAREFARACAVEKFDLQIICTRRSFEEQAKLYRMGRSLPMIEKKAGELSVKYKRPDLANILLNVGPQYGKNKLTKAGPGQSDHNYGHAIDCCPLRFGKLIWLPEGIPDEEKEDERLWIEYGRIAKAVGFTWSGDWTKFKEYPHIYNPGHRWRDLILNNAA